MKASISGISAGIDAEAPEMYSAGNIRGRRRLGFLPLGVGELEPRKPKDESSETLKSLKSRSLRSP